MTLTGWIPIHLCLKQNKKKGISYFTNCQIKCLIASWFLFPLNFLWDTWLSTWGKTFWGCRRREHEAGQSNQCTPITLVRKGWNEHCRTDKGSTITIINPFTSWGSKIKQLIYHMAFPVTPSHTTLAWF